MEGIRRLGVLVQSFFLYIQVSGVIGGDEVVDR